MGGSFNPIHRGHIDMALRARDELCLDRVLLIPDSQPPHKRLQEGATAKQRLRMVELAAQGHSGLEASDIELLREGKSYTADTLTQLSGLYPNSELYFILGSDMLRTLHSWYCPQRIFELCTVLCITRSGQSGSEQQCKLSLERDFGARIILLEPVRELSSTQIRSCIESFEPIVPLVGEGVCRYIYSNGLYMPRDIASMIGTLRGTLPQKRFDHTVGVMMRAVELAARHGANAKQAFIAALLHDCAKHLSLDELMSLTGGTSEYAPVLHAPCGAIIARRDYGVKDEAVLRAIRLHTTGGDNMTVLDKIIYLADATEPQRDYEGVQELRKVESLDLAMTLALEQARCYIKSKGAEPLKVLSELFYTQEDTNG